MKKKKKLLEIYFPCDARLGHCVVRECGGGSWLTVTVVEFFLTLHSGPSRSAQLSSAGGQTEMQEREGLRV